MFQPDYMARPMTMAQAAREFTERVNEPDFSPPYVTVWENAAGKRAFPTGLFEGPIDARWTSEADEQYQPFVGEIRRERQLEEAKLGRGIY